MARRKDGLEISNVNFREGSGPYMLAQLPIGGTHMDSIFIKHYDIDRDELTAATKLLNQKWGSWIGRAKKAGVRVETSTCKGLTEAGDVVVTLVIKRIA